MTKFKIEVSRPYQIFIWLGIIAIVAIAAFSITISVVSKNIFLFLISIMFLGYIWIFIRNLLLNITITDKSFDLSVAGHKSRSINIPDILVVRLKNKNDYIVRSNPVFSKNVVAIEYLNTKKEKTTFYFSLSQIDSINVIKLLEERGC